MNDRCNEYYIVSGAAWNNDGLKYRRHRLAEFLARDFSTSKVYWVFPKTGIAEKTRDIQPNIVELAMPDLMALAKTGCFMQSRVNKILLSHLDYQKNNYLWFTHPSYPCLSDKKRWHKIIYDCSDLWFSPGLENNLYKSIYKEIRGKMLLNSEKRIARKSDIIFATSDYLSDHIFNLSGKNPVLIENGVDYDNFYAGKEAELTGIPKPRLGFVGGLKQKIDFDLLSYIAEKAPQLNIVLIGPKADQKIVSFEKMLNYNNVYHVGAVDYSKIPLYMRALDVGLLPYRFTEYNKAISPLKLFEYLAAGLPAVGQGLPSIKKYAEKGVYYHTHTYEEFLSGCLAAIKAKDNNIFTQKRKELARANNWPDKLNKMVSHVLGAVK